MKKAIGYGLMVTIVLVLSSSSLIAQAKYSFQYAVKFICGRSDGKIMAKGMYYTSINVHNPSDNPISIQKKFAIVLPGEKTGPVTKFFGAKLGPDEALEIGNYDIFFHTEPHAIFVTGFAVIKSDFELDVVAVYTVESSTGQLETLDIEYVSPRQILVTGVSCPDLIVEKIEKPVWDSTNKCSVIRATIKNIGNAPAGISYARVIDPSTTQDPGVPYDVIAETPALTLGASTILTFYLPYWVYNPDVTLEVTADYKNEISECNENNNVKTFSDIG